MSDRNQIHKKDAYKYINMAENELIVSIGTLTTEKVLKQIGTSKYMYDQETLKLSGRENSVKRLRKQNIQIVY